MAARKQPRKSPPKSLPKSPSRAATLPALSPQESATRDAFAGKTLGAFIGTLETFAMQLGLRLGYYALLDGRGPTTSRQLARLSSTAERYAREWLEQQAVAGILAASPDKDAARRTYTLPRAHADVLLNQDGPAFLGFAPAMASAVSAQLPALVRAYRTGRGVAWQTYGPEMALGQGQQNRGFLRGTFAPTVLPAIPDVHRRLRGKRPARVADLACGVGWAAIAIAETYPNVRVDGLDLDAVAVKAGSRQVRELGLEGRVRLQVKDAATPALAGQYDLVVMVEALHDLSQPVPVLRAARNLLAPGGTMIVVDENVLEEFTAPGPDLERVFYGFSVLGCLPNGLADTPSAATGTVMRPSTVETYAKAAGFTSCQVLPIAHDFFRFYRLDP
jgi:SAM-dependent methyltransferase